MKPQMLTTADGETLSIDRIIGVLWGMAASFMVMGAVLFGLHVLGTVGEYAGWNAVGLIVLAWVLMVVSGMLARAQRRA